MVYMPHRFQGRSLPLWRETSLLDSSLTLSQKSAVIFELAAVWSPAPLLKSSLSIPSTEIDLEGKIIPALVLVLSGGFVESHFWAGNWKLKIALDLQPRRQFTGTPASF